VVEESGREQDVAITQHPKTEERLALEPPFSNKDVTLRPAPSLAESISTRKITSAGVHILAPNSQLGKDVTKGSLKWCLNGATLSWQSRTGGQWSRTTASDLAKIAKVNVEHIKTWPRISPILNFSKRIKIAFQNKRTFFFSSTSRDL